jgi:type II secretory pathway component PulL
LITNKKKIDEILKKQEQLNSKNVDQSLKNQAENLYSQLFPEDIDFQLQKRIRDLEQANQVHLTDSQRHDVAVLFDLE